VSCWAFSGHSSFFAKTRRKDENERPQTIQRQEISEMVFTDRVAGTIHAKRARCLDIQGGQPMSGWFATGLPLAFGDASVHMRPRMSLLYG
jgi:hypothetical protein